MLELMMKKRKMRTVEAPPQKVAEPPLPPPPPPPPVAEPPQTYATLAARPPLVEPPYNAFQRPMFNDRVVVSGSGAKTLGINWDGVIGHVFRKISVRRSTGATKMFAMFKSLYAADPTAFRKTNPYHSTPGTDGDGYFSMLYMPPDPLPELKRDGWKVYPVHMHIYGSISGTYYQVSKIVICLEGNHEIYPGPRLESSNDSASTLTDE